MSELKAAQVYMEAGHEAYLPAIRNGPVDMVVQKGEKLYRVQVKTATWIRSGPYRYLQARIRSANRQVTSQSGHYDILVVVYGEEVWEIPAKRVRSTNICLRGTRPGRTAEAWDRYKIR